MKFFSLLILCYLLMIVQIGIIPDVIVEGSRPNLILLVLCFALFWHRDATVFVWAIITGLICETFDSATPGTGVLLLTCLIWIAFRMQTHFQIRSLLSRFVLVFAITFLFDGLFQLLNQLDTNALPNLNSLARQASGNAIYTAVAGLALLITFKTMERFIPVTLKSNLQNSALYGSRFSH